MNYENTKLVGKLEIRFGYDENIRWFFRITKLNGIELALFNRLININTF